MVKIEYVQTADGTHRLVLTARSQADQGELDNIMKTLTMGRSKRTKYDSTLVGVLEYRPFPEPSPVSKG